MSSPRGARLRALAPWLVTAAALAWLFRTVPVHELGRALAKVPVGAFVTVVVTYVLATLVADTAALWATLRLSLRDVPLGFYQVLRLRAATYLMAVLHYSVGQGGVAWFLRDRYGVPLARGAGAMMLTMGVNALVVAACAALGMALGGAPASPTLRLVIFALMAGIPVYAAVVAIRPRFLADRAVLRPLFDAGLGGTLAMAAARLPHLAVLVGFNWVAMRLFGVRPPIGAALALFPLVFVVAVLPISPAGLGTAQTMCVLLFSPFATGTPAERAAAVLAYSLGLQSACLVLQAGIGALFLRSLTRPASVGDGNDASAPRVA